MPTLQTILGIASAGALFGIGAFGYYFLVIRKADRTTSQNSSASDDSMLATSLSVSSPAATSIAAVNTAVHPHTDKPSDPAHH